MTIICHRHHHHHLILQTSMSAFLTQRLFLASLAFTILSNLAISYLNLFKTDVVSLKIWSDLDWFRFQIELVHSPVSKLQDQDDCHKSNQSLANSKSNGNNENLKKLKWITLVGFEWQSVNLVRPRQRLVDESNA